MTTTVTMFLTHLIVVLFTFTCTTYAFEITKFEVPEQVHRGTSAIFTCEYDLKPFKQLYTLRWLKNNVEFFRFDPALKPQHNFYTIHGLHVNVSEGKKVLFKSSNYNCSFFKP